MRHYQDRLTEAIANPARQTKSVAQMIFIIFLTLAVMVPAADAQTQYELTWLGEGRPRDINESGVVAFGYAASAYDHATGVKLDLNAPAYGATWTDLEGNEDETGQWIVYHCNGINESNQIIGTASRIDGSEENRNFILNDPLGATPVFELIPRSILEANQGNICINDLGEIAEGREINNFGVVVTNGGNIRDPISGDMYFPGHSFTGINDLGMITGFREAVSNGPPSGRVTGGPIRFDSPYDPEEIQDGGDLILLDSGNATNYHGDVNNFGDVCYSHSSRGYVALADATGNITDSPLNLDDLIVTQNQQDFDDWIGTAIFPSGINDAGQIIGQAQKDGWHGFILTPIVPGPTISVNDLTINEGNNGTTTEGQFTITLSELTGQDVLVPYEIVDGTATAGNDYTTVASSGLLTFAFSAGETSKTVEFAIVGDDTNEPDETFTIVLGEAVGGATVTSGTGTATIKNDEVSNVTMSVDDPSVIEGDRKDKTPGEFTITLSVASASDVQVWYQVSNGSAGNKDYRMVDSASGLLTFAAGDTSETVRFDVLGDTRSESDETFTIELTDAFGATISKSVGTATIIDND